MKRRRFLGHEVITIEQVLNTTIDDMRRSVQKQYRQIPHRTNDPDFIKKQYRRLALLLHPDKNKFPFSDSAFRLVADSWAVLSDPAKKSLYDTEFSARFARLDLKQQPHHQKRGRPPNSNSGHKLPVRRSFRGGDDDEIRSANNKTGGASHNSAPWRKIWTACPYCYNLYEYPRQYEGCCLRCGNKKCGGPSRRNPQLRRPPRPFIFLNINVSSWLPYASSAIPSATSANN